MGELVRVRGGVSCVAGLRETTHVELKKASYHSAYTVLWARVDSTHHPQSTKNSPHLNNYYSNTHPGTKRS